MDELKQNIKETLSLAQKYEQAGERLAEAKSEYFDTEGEIMVSALGMLMKKIYDVVDDWVKVNAEKVDQEKQLCDTIKKSIEDVITAISQQKVPTIEFKPQIKVDIQPMANEIAKQNEAMLKILNKLSVEGGRTDETHRLISVMVQKQMAFLENAFKQNDYTKQLNELLEIVKNEIKPKPIVESIEIKRDERGIKTLIPIYKNNKK